VAVISREWRQSSSSGKGRVNYLLLGFLSWCLFFDFQLPLLLFVGFLGADLDNHILDLDIHIDFPLNLSFDDLTFLHDVFFVDLFVGLGNYIFDPSVLLVPLDDFSFACRSLLILRNFIHDHAIAFAFVEDDVVLEEFEVKDLATLAHMAD